MDSSSTSPTKTRTQTDLDNDKNLLNVISTSGNIVEVNKLIDCGADVNGCIFYELTNTKLTALMLAAYSGHEKIVLALINVGADVNTENEDGWSALSLAAKQGHLAIVNILLHHITLDSFNDPILFCQTTHPLCVAAKNSHLEIVLALLPKFKIASWNIITPLDLLKTPLIRISKFNHPAIIEIYTTILSRFDPATLDNTRDNVGNNILMLSVLGKHTAMLYALLSVNADVNAKNSHNHYTALMMAAKTDDFEMMSILIQAKAYVITALAVTFTHETIFLLLSALPPKRVLALKKSAAFKGVFSDCIKEVNEIRDNIFHSLFILQTGAKARLPTDLLKLIFSYDQKKYPEWYQLRLQDEVQAMSSRVIQVLTQKNKAKRAAKANPTAMQLPPLSPTFLPIAAALAETPSTYLPIVDQMAALTIHANNEKADEKKRPKQKKSS
jgi:ankyrin repeat protein